jgi:hypothetical protein
MLGGRHFSPEEVDIACGQHAETTRPLWGALERLGIVSNIGENETGIAQFRLRSPGCEWDVWGDLLAFQKQVMNALPQLIVDLRFDLLD